MSVNSGCFLLVARHSLELDKEIGYRMAIGRSYYAMIHKLLESFEQYEYNPESSGTHKDIYEYLNDGDGARLEGKESLKFKALAYKLQQAKQKRVIADYKTSVEFDRRTAEAVIRESEQFLLKVEELFPIDKMTA